MRVQIFGLIVACFAVIPSAVAQATPASGLPDGTHVFDGWWDSGGCYGDDQRMCDVSGATENMTGCVVEAKQCRSGLARAEATQPGDGVCVIRWWGYGCYSEGAPKWSGAQIEGWREKTFQRMREERVRYAIRRAQSYPSNPCSFSSDIGDAAPLTIAFAVHEGGGSPAKLPWLASNNGIKTVRLDVDEALASQPSPFILAVSTYEPVLFELSDRIQDKLVGVISTGYYPSRFRELPRNVPVYFTSYVGDEVRANNCQPIDPVWINGASDTHILDRTVWSLVSFYGSNDAGIDYIRYESRPAEMVLTIEDIAPPPPPPPSGQEIVVTQ